MIGGMAEFTVDTARPDDLDTLLPLVAQLFREDAGTRDPTSNVDWPASDEARQYYADLIADPASLVALARGDGQTVGYLVGKLREPDSGRPVRFAILESMLVSPAARGQGAGGRLVEAFFTWARERAAEWASVSAYVANEDAQRFYARAGFAGHTLTMRARV
jgi:GNAT superfamily N-acetyltransferase